MAIIERQGYLYLPTAALPEIGFPNEPLSAQRETDLLESSEKELLIILDEQDPGGLFPASTRLSRDIFNHYDCHWPRDGFITAKALVDSRVLNRYPQNSKMGRRIRSSSNLYFGKTLEMLNEEADNGKFMPGIEKGKEINTADPQKLPRIHTKIDGSFCEWYANNQPDSFGHCLTAIGQAIQNRVFIPNERGIQIIEKIAGYLVHIEPWKFKASSMWEDQQVFPPPLSTVAFVRQGLLTIMPFMPKRELQERIEETAFHCREYLIKNYPREKTTPNHPGEFDLATGIALGEGAFSDIKDIDPREWLEAAKSLGREDCPGKIRFWGDPYHNPYSHSTEGVLTEAPWPMGLLYEAKIYLDLYKQTYVEKYRNLAFDKLQKAMDIGTQYGFRPELLEQFRPHEFKLPEKPNQLLWDMAVYIRVCHEAAEVLQPAA
ncbi:hypothetical protein M1615_05255 [Patescibacteria group bacterium]|nr:hypothetical protein [Patescibacteria group bacterium]MCL5010018.1 hypothetical protein [Patescibacteria group bacterium]